MMIDGIRVKRVRTGEDGISHLSEVTIPVSLKAVSNYETDWLPVNGGAFFRRTPGDRVVDFHNAPRRQLLIVLSGAMELTLGDGTTLVLAPGDILLAEDLDGQGHQARDLPEHGPRTCVCIPLPEDFDTSGWE